MRRWKELATETRGAEIAEAALVLPLVFMLLLGIFWLGRAYNIYATITHAAREGARAAVASSCATCPVNSVCNWGGTSFPCDQTVVDAVTSVLQASRLDPSRLSVYGPSPAPTFCPGLTPPGACSTSSKVRICRGVLLNPGSSPEECGTVVSFQYPFSLPLPFASPSLQTVNIKTQVEARLEQ